MALLSLLKKPHSPWLSVPWYSGEVPLWSLETGTGRGYCHKPCVTLGPVRRMAETPLCLFLSFLGRCASDCGLFGSFLLAYDLESSGVAATAEDLAKAGARKSGTLAGRHGVKLRMEDAMLVRRN